MKQFFNVDNIIFRGISKWMDYIFVSFLWFVFSIPLITMGAATAALYHTSGQCLISDRGYIFRSFWGSFKNSFRQSTILAVILGVLFGAIHLDMNLVRGQAAMKMLQTLFVAARLLFLMIGVYVFPYISKYRMGMVQIIKDCVCLCVLSLPWTILLTLILTAALCLISIIPGAILIMPSCVGVFFNLILERIFSKYGDNGGEGGRLRKITYFVPYPELIPVVRRLMDQPCYQGIFVNASIQYFPIMYDVEVEDDCDLVIARGYSIHVIRERFSGAIVEIPITGSDIVKAIAQCRKNTNCQKIGLIGDYSNMKDIQSMSSLFNINFVVYVIDNPDQIEDMVKRAIEEGCDALISGSHANKCVIKNGFKVYSGIIENSEEAIARALNSAASLLKNMEYEASQMELLRLLAENVTDGLIFVDDRERIRIANANVGRIFPNRRPVAGKGFQEEFSFMTRNYLKACREKQHLDNEIYRTRDMNIAVDFTPVMIEDNYKGMIITIRDIGRLQQREAQIRTKLNEMGLYAKYQFSDIIHQSPVMEHVIQRARKFASVTSNVLVYGETGTGKELVAQSIHNASKRKNGPFVAINCASFPENLLESELFGYEEGAFTGAVKGGKAGLFEQAHNGTLFLDEVSELPVSFQGKLLRVLQEREVRRVGGKRVVKIDVRIIAATNKNLKQMIQEGLFREDLLYRLDVLNLSIPPLRKRREDIRLLAEYFLLKYKEQFETCADHFTGHAVELLCGYPFKGNIRELRNIVERLSVTVQDATVHASDVEESLGLNDTDTQPYPIQHPGQMPPVYQDSPADPIYAKEIRKEEVVSLLKECGYNKSEVARRLGINRTTLWRKMGKMGLL